MKKGLTKFQWKVLKEVARIPLGETRSYEWIAKKIGHPKAVRAVGSALKKNPYPVIIPCHRVIKKDGTFGGYAGQSNNMKKKRLLDIEKQIACYL